ncbi:MAG: VOC family protein, partial [SAR202 cluster bacterium]|nr:VOC family protein [SAR202 cluster bacterium]
MFAMGTPDVAAEAAAMQGRGVDVGEPALGTRDAQGNAPAYTWEAAPVASDATPGSETFLIQHHMAMSERYTQPPDASRHANGATGVAGLALAVPDVSVAAAAWERVLGRRPEPVQERASEAGHRARFALGGL